jgi:hypothetical protein
VAATSGPRMALPPNANNAVNADGAACVPKAVSFHKVDLCACMLVCVYLMMV